MNFMDSAMLLVGNIPQYFFDNLVIEQIQDLTRRVHSPKKEPDPLIKKDRPWENIPYFCFCNWNLGRDDATGEFSCWYEDFAVDEQQHSRTTFDAWKKAGVWPSFFSRLCYARSGDGLNWEKPELDYYEEDGRKTNVVFGNSSLRRADASVVFYDPIESNPEKRFKQLFTRLLPGGNEASVYKAGASDAPTDKKEDGTEAGDGSFLECRVEMAYSPDGVHWTPSEDQLQFGPLGRRLGDGYTFTADVEAGLYRLLTRHSGMGSVHYDERRPRTNSFFPPTFPHDISRLNTRRVFQSVSSDMIHWTTPQCILTPDPQEDNLDDSYYGMVQFRLGELHVGLLNVLHAVSNTMDIRLVYSRDGWRWYHLNRRQPWLTTSADSWDRYQVDICDPPVAVGDEHFVYYAGCKHHHDWWITGLRDGFGITGLREELDVPEVRNLDKGCYGLGLAKMRLDGFVSIDAGAVREGVLVTRTLRTDSKQIALNAVCGDSGYIQVEVTDAEEQVLEGCARAQCDTFSGDSTQRIITWKGQADIPHRGSLRLRFFMRNASLYSFTFI